MDSAIARLLRALIERSASRLAEAFNSGMCTASFERKLQMEFRDLSQGAIVTMSSRVSDWSQVASRGCFSSAHHIAKPTSVLSRTLSSNLSCQNTLQP